MSRLVAPEILDHLPPDSDAARLSRRDLRHINAALGSPAWFRRELVPRLRPGDRVLEIGAGDGNLRQVAPPGIRWDALDPSPPPAGWPADAQWHRSDAQHFQRWSEYSVIAGNLVFHHLTSSELAALGAAIRPHARLIVASEPTRARSCHFGYRLLCLLLRAHPVTRHDGKVSIDAGFRGDELAAALGLAPSEGWHCLTPRSWRGAYRLIAFRPA